MIFIRESKMSRDVSVQKLLTRLNWLEELQCHPDDVAWSFIDEIVLLSDGSLLDIAPDAIKSKVYEILDLYLEHDDFRVFAAKGNEVDVSEKMHRLSLVLKSK